MERSEVKVGSFYWTYFFPSGETQYKVIAKVLSMVDEFVCRVMVLMPLTGEIIGPNDYPFQVLISEIRLDDVKSITQSLRQKLDSFLEQ